MWPGIACDTRRQPASSPQEADGRRGSGERCREVFPLLGADSGRSLVAHLDLIIRVSSAEAGR